MAPKIFCTSGVKPEISLPALSRRRAPRSEEHTSELQSQSNVVCRLLLEQKTSPPHRQPKGRRSGPPPPHLPLPTPSSSSPKSLRYQRFLFSRSAPGAPLFWVHCARSCAN